MKLFKLILLIEVLLFLSFVALDGMGYLPISQTIYILPFIWLVLKLKKQPFASIGLEFKKAGLTRSVAIGIALGIILELFATYFTTPLLSSYLGAEPDLSGISEIEGNLALLFIYLLLSWALGAFGEEVCFRGFLMNRLAHLFGDHKASWIVALVLSSMVFGIGHTEQGITGWIQEGLSGLYLGVIFLSFNKNLLIPMISHGVSNTLALYLIYLGVYPGI